MHRSELARRSGVNGETIRFFEKEGLLQAPERSAGNYRVYNDAHLTELRFISAMQDLGFDRGLIGAILRQAREDGDQVSPATLQAELSAKSASIAVLLELGEGVLSGPDGWAAEFIREGVRRLSALRRGPANQE